MSTLPIPANTTMDIYHGTHVPPAAPDVAGVSTYLTPDFARDHDKAIQNTTYLRWTHVALVPLNTDIRDDYQASPTALTPPSTEDAIYIPDKNGTKFLVIFVERINRKTTQECLRVFLLRQRVTWPTQNL